MERPGGISPALAGDYLNNLVAALRNANTSRSIDHISNLAAQLLASLINPKNVSLLTLELLKAPALWQRSAGQETVLQVSHRIVTVFAFAADRRRTANLSPFAPGMSCMAFTHAVIQGLNDQEKHIPPPGFPQPSRPKDLMVFAGLLMGFGEKKDKPPAPVDSSYFEHNLQRPSLQIAQEYVKDNLEPAQWQPAVVLALTIIFPGLPMVCLPLLPTDGFLVIAMRALTGPDGLDDGRILTTIDSGITHNGGLFEWSSTSPSFADFRNYQQKIFVLNMASLAKIIGYAIQRASDTNVVLQVLDDLVTLSATLLKQWQNNKLCTADITTDALVFTPHTQAVTWPALWGFFRWTLYSFTAILGSIVTRGLIDQGLGAGNTGVVVASKALSVLRNLAFISTYKGADAFEGYSYVRLAALDKLATNPQAITHFLRTTKRATPSVAKDPIEAAMDLFYLTSAEHLPLNMDLRQRESLIVGPATVYLKPFGPLSLRMKQLFEAANAAVLAVLSCPNNEPVTITLVPFYIETLLRAFPAHMSPRQFRLAFKTLVKVLSPPNAVYSSNFHLCDVVMELANQRVQVAADDLLPSAPGEEAGPPFSEKNTLVLAMIDALPFLSHRFFQDWLTTTALAVNHVRNGPMLKLVRERFCSLAKEGEWDPWQVPVFLAWWTEKGGCEGVLQGTGPLVEGESLMSGAILPSNYGAVPAHF